jgi:hypothetical protein
VFLVFINVHLAQISIIVLRVEDIIDWMLLVNAIVLQDSMIWVTKLTVFNVFINVAHAKMDLSA